ncbi:MAG: purine-nucleoside phosphorylase [Clostridiales bacterium]|nr:purine-nucleoside phosphorylase [Clostridiales bacterium]
MPRKMKKIYAAAEAVRTACGSAQIGIVLGSGLAGFEKALEDPREINFDEIPGFPKSAVAGHAAKFIAGTIHDKRVLVMSGRYHHYEGHSLFKVTIPIRVMALLGVNTLILTNAAGGVNTSFSPGDLMMITDYINLSGHNPLRGRNLDEFGPRFPDMTNAFDKQLQSIALQRAAYHNIKLHRGVYTWWNGPSYETPAEIRMVRSLGGDAVGMSTVPETIVARHCGMRVLGISSITNMAAGVIDAPIKHDDVLAMGAQVGEKLRLIIDSFIEYFPLQEL